MVDILVQRTFRHASGALARFVDVDITDRGSPIVLQTVTTDDLGLVSLYMPVGQYDWLVYDHRIPFDVISNASLPPDPFIHDQPVPAATWTLTHNRGTRPPVVLVLDSFPDERIYTDVTYPDLNTAVVEWPTAETGKAYIQ